MVYEVNGKVVETTENGFLDLNHNGEQPNNRAMLKAMQEKWAGRKVAGLPESLRKGGY